ncbi:uncharacterized protein LOC124917434 [Impatiens glandulifera]|uniref:uncharacterized protein LOC124917434 n=1 Tax=Impatiens glandulifera TaxID=253017 RepID=UPI001FB0FB78|nr:uncharacterized protein LOC124917434 [Impatiens glandulifera]
MASLNVKLLFLHFFIFYCFTFTIAASSSTNGPTVYQVFPKFGLPTGLLPNSVKSYSLSPDGEFVIEMEYPCFIRFEYLVYYETKITGKLKYGSISDLKGIQVQRFLLWFDVDVIRVDLPLSDSIYFQIGMINKRLEINQFKTVHTCTRKELASSIQPPNPKGDIEMLITE